jgi:hypothetical protein
MPWRPAEADRDVPAGRAPASAAGGAASDLAAAQRALLADRLAAWERGGRSARPRRDDAGAIGASRAAAPDGPPALVTAGGVSADLAAWLDIERAAFLDALHEHGAVLFRGFGIDEPDAFAAVAARVLAEVLAHNGEHRPVTPDGTIQEPVEYPAAQHLRWHHENTFNARWPTKLLFACARPAATGGETPLVDGRAVLARMDPAVRERFRTHGIRYDRHYTDGLHRSWRQIFGVESREALEARCRESGVAWEWTPGGTLKTRALRPAVARHPVTGASTPCGRSIPTATSRAAAPSATAAPSRTRPCWS